MKPTTTVSPVDPEFPYGWRFVQRGDVTEQVPLTLEDVLHPQEGDVIPNNTWHGADCRYLTSVFESRPLSPSHPAVTCDVLVAWGVEGIRNHSPDVAVFVGMNRPVDYTGLLDLSDFRGRCELIVEVVSPSTRKNDVVDKFDHYFRIGIPLYVIIDQESEHGPRTLRVYRRTPSAYVEIEHDAQGRVLLPPLRLHIGMRDSHPICFDADTGDEIEGASEVIANRAKEREQARLQREEADQAIAEQVDARHEAERQADAARKEAEKQRKEMEELRQQLEANEKAKKLKEVQDAERIRALEDLVKQLQARGANDATSTT